jgi:uncharacterized protein DUF2877
LIGYLAGLWSRAGDDEKKLTFIESFGKVLFQLLDQTNGINGIYLYHAIHAQFSSSLINLVNAIADDEKGQLLLATKDALGVGHSSGMDSITGLSVGLAVWDNHSPSLLSERRTARPYPEDGR